MPFSAVNAKEETHGFLLEPPFLFPRARFDAFVLSHVWLSVQDVSFVSYESAEVGALGHGVMAGFVF